MGLKILGTGSALPSHMVTNEQLTKMVDTSDEWIASRTGIRQRHISTGETTTELCVRAARRALENAGMQAEELELIVVATLSGDRALPNTGCEVQRELNAVHATAFEINAACSGFLFALNTVQAYMVAGLYRKALVIGGEVLSKLVDWQDRNTCVLFGDGAGAAVVEADPARMYYFDQGSDGSRGEALSCPGRPLRSPFVATDHGSSPYIFMDGQEVFRFAVKKVPETVALVLQKAGLTAEDVDLFLLHQANERILQAAARRIGAPVSKFPMNMQACGNTSAASIPILLDEANRKGLLKRGQTVVLSGFGAGLTWGTALFQW